MVTVFFVLKIMTKNSKNSLKIAAKKRICFIKTPAYIN